MEAISVALTSFWHLMIILIVIAPTFWVFNKVLGWYGNTTKKTYRKFKS